MAVFINADRAPQLGQARAAFSDIPTGAASRLLLGGYYSRSEVQRASDWELLHVRGLGKAYLAAIRKVMPYKAPGGEQEVQDEKDVPKAGYSYRVWLRADFIIGFDSVPLQEKGYDALLVSPMPIPDLDAEEVATVAVWRTSEGGVAGIEIRAEDRPHFILLNWPCYFLPVIPEEDE